MHRHLHGILSLLPIVALLLLIFVGRPRPRTFIWLRILLALVPFGLFVLTPAVSHQPSPGLQLYVAFFFGVASPFLVTCFRYAVPMLVLAVFFWNFLHGDFMRTAYREGPGSAPPHYGRYDFAKSSHARMHTILSMDNEGNELPIGEGWVDDLVPNDREMREYAAFFLKDGIVIERWRPEWHTWLTNIHRAEHIPAGLWSNGSNRKPGVPEYEVRPRSPSDRRRAYERIIGDDIKDRMEPYQGASPRSSSSRPRFFW